MKSTSAPETNATVHVYKTNCYGSSRVMMQAALDKKVVLLHLINKGTVHHKAFEEYRYSVFRLMHLLFKNNPATFVFHAQSSLPCLALALLVPSLFLKARHKFVYDMHDLHEQCEASSVWEYFRYGIIRGAILGWLERWCVENKAVTVITVSNGLAEQVSSKYNCTLPTIIRNIEKPRVTNMACPTAKVNDQDLVFFGDMDRVPFELFDKLATSCVRLHLYGRNITRDAVMQCAGLRAMESIVIHGQYRPWDLSFLHNYAFLVLYKPNIRSFNFKFSLPNKLFQALEFGMSVLVSENFVEIQELFASIPGAVEVIDAEQDLRSVMKKALDARGGEYHKRLRSYLGILRAESESNYKKIILC